MEMMKTGVWWDMDTCLLPQGFDPYKVRQRIESALEKHLPFTSSAIGDVPFTISAIGDLSRIPETDLEAILSTGFVSKWAYFPGPVGIMHDMYRWAENHPPPARVILISDHEDKFVERAFFDSLLGEEFKIIRAYTKFPKPDFLNLDSATSQEIKSSIEEYYCETGWLCYTCIDSIHTFAGESFESLNRHLKSEEHRHLKSEELRILEGKEGDSSSLPVKTAVWWDIDTCLPQEYAPCQFRQSIESAFKEFLPMTISAIGNLKRFPHTLVEPFLSCGISMKHSPHGTSSIMMEMSTWARDNPPPATLILISDREEEFVESGVLPSFKHRGYTIVRAFQKHPKVSPIYAAQTILLDYLLPAWYEVTDHEVEDKCSATAWHCDLCISSGLPFAGETLESLIRHFKTPDHLFQELMLKCYEAEASTRSRKMGVWWDISTCQVPQKFDPCKVRQKLESAFSHCRPTTVLAFGNLEHISPSVLEAISSTGIILRHVQEGQMKSIFLDMKRWTGKNPPPATLVLISDREEHFFGSGLLPSFEERGYTRSFVRFKSIQKFHSITLLERSFGITYCQGLMSMSIDPCSSGEEEASTQSN
ncbi:unnamed protein product [Microthlaspi erraticum]|uniref:NYN domain-containing protein n=1 Tax=Microthlaspi erraticum TaxID=1685480 RepID=A0A6D2L2C5_9BRAS|nr:unnamed protein product [Microthlaspi erraticum]CAA7054129.1 unnamed protein product [Microthlaspi erraticum]